LPNATQGMLFPLDDAPSAVRDRTSSTFADNMRLPVHRWIRFSAGFSAAWAESIIADSVKIGTCRVFDPFAGSGTTLIAAENAGAESYGIEAHPFVSRLTRAKLVRRSDPEAYRDLAHRILRSAAHRTPHIDGYPPLIRKCYDDDTLAELDTIRQAVDDLNDGSPAARLSWLTLVGILRKVSHVNTAQWQYVLPRKSKKCPLPPFPAFEQLATIVYHDMLLSADIAGPPAHFLQQDARTCSGVPEGFANLVVTSPPYPNNFDYADATRLEMSFFREVNGWGDLQDTVRQYLIRSCSQHVPERSALLDDVLASRELAPIRQPISDVCQELAAVRLTKGGKKTYHLMVACYFLDLAQVWNALRKVCASPCRVCFIIGDSAPYGVYVPVMDWLGALALDAGFDRFTFERTRDRNVKWKNRKHRVPLCEGRLWVYG